MQQRVIFSLLTGLLMTGSNAPGSSGAGQHPTTKPTVQTKRPAEVSICRFKYDTPNHRPAAPAGDIDNTGHASSSQAPHSTKIGNEH